MRRDVGNVSSLGACLEDPLGQNGLKKEKRGPKVWPQRQQPPTHPRPHTHTRTHTHTHPHACFMGGAGGGGWDVLVELSQAGGTQGAGGAGGAPRAGAAERGASDRRPSLHPLACSHVLASVRVLKELMVKVPQEVSSFPWDVGDDIPGEFVLVVSEILSQECFYAGICGVAVER